MNGEDSLVFNCPQCGSAIPAGSLLCPVCNPAPASTAVAGGELRAPEAVPPSDGEGALSTTAVDGASGAAAAGLPVTFQFQDVDFGPSDEELDRAFTPRDGRYATYVAPVSNGAMASGASAAATFDINGYAVSSGESHIPDLVAGADVAAGAAGVYDYSTASGDFTQTFDPEVWGDDMAKAAKPLDGVAKVVVMPVGTIAAAGQMADAMAGFGGQGVAAGAGVQAAGQAVGAATQAAGHAAGAVSASSSVSAASSAAHAAPIVQAVGQESAVAMHVIAPTADAGMVPGTAGVAATAPGTAAVASDASATVAASGATTAAAAGGATAKAGIPLLAKIVAGVLVVGTVAVGGYSAWSGQRVDYTANFVDATSQQALAEPVTGTGNSGDVVELTAQDIEGYQLKGAAEQSVTLEVGQDAEVTFLYQKETGYAVQYVDQDGADVLAAKSGTGVVGDAVTEEAPQVDGYELTSNNAFKLTLQEDEAANVITFTYAKKVTYTVRYVSTDGIELLGATTGDGVVGAVVEPGEAPGIAGYTLVSVPQAITLSVDEGENVMTFTYELIPEPVTVQKPSKKKKYGDTPDF